MDKSELKTPSLVPGALREESFGPNLQSLSYSLRDIEQLVHPILLQNEG